MIVIIVRRVRIVIIVIRVRIVVIETRVIISVLIVITVNVAALHVLKRLVPNVLSRRSSCQPGKSCGRQ